MPMPQAFRIVIFKEMKEVEVRDPMSGKTSSVTVPFQTYHLAFGGRLVCRDLTDKNLLLVLFGAYMNFAVYHPEVINNRLFFIFLSFVCNQFPSVLLLSLVVM